MPTFTRNLLAFVAVFASSNATAETVVREGEFFYRGTGYYQYPSYRFPEIFLVNKFYQITFSVIGTTLGAFAPSASGQLYQDFYDKEGRITGGNFQPRFYQSPVTFSKDRTVASYTVFAEAGTRYFPDGSWTRFGLQGGAASGSILLSYLDQPSTLNPPNARYRMQIDITDVPFISVLPELGEWAALIIGFFLVGSSIRMRGRAKHSSAAEPLGTLS